jgi:hypothetical protein
MCFDGGTYIGVSTIGKTWKVVAFERAPVRYTRKRGLGGSASLGQWLEHCHQRRGTKKTHLSIGKTDKRRGGEASFEQG